MFFVLFLYISKYYASLLQALICPFDQVNSESASEKKAIGSDEKKADETETMEKKNILLRLNEFLFSLNIDNLNLFKVLRFINAKDLMRKVVFSLSFLLLEFNFF